MKYIIIALTLMFIACGTPPKDTKLKNVSDFIVVHTPQPFEKVTGTIVIKGEARGNYFFEADFPVEVVLENGEVINHYAMADDEWMTEEFVPFTSTIDISGLEPQDVIIKLHRNNPSDNRENDMVMELPVTID